MENKKITVAALIARRSALEKEFFDNENSLCENKSPKECDCSKCPTRQLCQDLETVEKQLNDLEKEQFELYLYYGLEYGNY